jgi:broad specificity phosphatase PhoE
VSGAAPLPLAEAARDRVADTVAQLHTPVTAIYRDKANEAADATAAIVAERFNLKARHNADLAEVQLGLWEGLTVADVQKRFPTVWPQYLANPLAVTPPDGEPLDAAIARVRRGLAAVLRRNRGITVAIPLRPRALQIAAGLLRDESPQIIAFHLHGQQDLAVVEIPDGDLHVHL